MAVRTPVISSKDALFNPVVSAVHVQPQHEPIFVKNPFTKQHAAYIRVDVLIQRLEDEANKGCGQYYELFESSLLESLQSVAATFDKANDLAAFTDAAASRGWKFDEESLRASADAKQQVWDEIRIEEW